MLSLSGISYAKEKDYPHPQFAHPDKKNVKLFLKEIHSLCIKRCMQTFNKIYINKLSKVLIENVQQEK
jgi:hypothetical protein